MAPFWLRIRFVVVAAGKNSPQFSCSLPLNHFGKLSLSLGPWSKRGFQSIWNSSTLLPRGTQSEASSSGSVADPDLCSQKFPELHFQKNGIFALGGTKVSTNETL